MAGWELEPAALRHPWILNLTPKKSVCPTSRFQPSEKWCYLPHNQRARIMDTQNIESSSGAGRCWAKAIIS